MNHQILLLLGVVICFNFTQTNAVNCSSAEGVRQCTLQSSPQSVEIVDGKLFVGTANLLQVFSLPGLQPSQSIDLSSDHDTVVSCSGFNDDQLGVDIEDCKNFIQTIQSFPDNKTMVCGTNAHHPKCNVHDANNLSNYRKLSSPGEIDAGYSPNSKTHPIEAILASNGRFFSATRFADFGSLTAIRMSPRALENDTTFVVGTPRDNRWLNTPFFVSVHEHGDHIFFFMSEPALELEGVQEVRYSRAIRICKTDDGVNPNGDLSMNNFLTFQKARMVCSVEGNIPYFYNDLVSTFVSHTEGEDVLYGVFNSQMNGPAGGAICKFSFEMITEVFDNRNYLVRMALDGRNVWEKTTAPTFSCPGSPTGEQRSPSDVLTYQLKFNSITPTRSPLFVSESEFLDKIAAETVHYQDAVEEILYFTNQEGDIMQVVLSGDKQYRHTILDSDSPNPVRDLILHRNNNKGSLVATSDGQIIEIPRGECSNYTDCFSCFDSKDVYCGWEPNLRRCLNKFDSSVPTLMQTFSASEATITTTCGNRPQLPTVTPTDATALPCTNKPSTNPNTVEVTSKTDLGEEGCFTTRNPISVGLNDASRSDSISIPVVVGAIIGAFLFGLSVGSIVCIIFFKRFTRLHSSKKAPAQIESAAPPIGNEVMAMQVNNNQTTEKENVEKPDVPITELQAVPPPRYINHNIKRPVPPPPPIAVSPTRSTLSSTTTILPPMYKHANSVVNLPETAEDDSAFSTDKDTDTLPPLKNFISPGTMYGSLGRNKTGSNGISRKQIPGHKVPRGRTDSTTWLRQRSESLSSDISSNTSPLQSPISDV